MKTETEQLKHRLAMVKDDLDVIRRFIYQSGLSKQFEQPTEMADECWTHLNNIEIACDLSNTESYSWTPFTWNGLALLSRSQRPPIPTSISVGVYYYIDEETGKPVFDTDSMTNEFETKLNNL